MKQDTLTAWTKEQLEHIVLRLESILRNPDALELERNVARDMLAFYRGNQ